MQESPSAAPPHNREAPGRSARGFRVTPSRSRGLGERGGVDDVAVAHARIHDVVVGGRDVLTGDHFDLRDDAVLGTEVQHLLSFGDAADLGASERLPAVNEGAQRQRDGLGGQAHIDEDAVGTQGRHVSSVVEAVGRHGAQDQVEGAAQRFESPLFAGRVEVVSTEAACVGFLRATVGDDRDVRAHSLGDLHAHVPETPQTQDGHARTGTHVVMLQRRVGGDTSAQERGAGRKIQLGRDMQRKVGAHREAPRVSSCRRLTLGVGTVGPQGSRRRGAPLLVAGLAHLASAARADQAAHAHAVPHLEGRHAGANLGDCANELMARHKRVSDGTPLAAGGMDVRVANARVGDIEVDLALARLTNVDLQGMELGGGIVATVSDYAGYHNSFVQSIRDDRVKGQKVCPESRIFTD